MCADRFFKCPTEAQLEYTVVKDATLVGLGFYPYCVLLGHH